MKGFWKKLCAACLCALMLCSAALADGLDWAAGSYVDGSAQFHLTAQLKSLTPYGQETLDQMNALLGNLSVYASVDENDTLLRFCVAGEPVASIREQQADMGTMLTTSLLPGRTLLSSGSAVDVLSGLDEQEESFDFFAAIQQAEGCYQELAEAILPFAEEKSASYSIENVGSARWVRLARLEMEQSAQITPAIAKVLGCGMDEAFQQQLAQMECLKGFTVALYRTKEDGADIAVYIKGNVRFADGVQRAISYQWAFGQNSKGQRVDTYKFDMTKAETPRDNRQITGTLRRTPDSGALLIKGQSKAVVRDPETNIVTTTTLSHDLSGQNGVIGGSVTHTQRVAKGEEGTTTTFTITPALQHQDGLLTGSVLVQKKIGNTVHAEIDLLLEEGAALADLTEAEASAQFVVIDDRLPQSSLTQNLNLGPEEPEDYLVGKPPIGYTAYDAPAEDITLDVSALNAEELAALTDEMTQRLAGSLLRAIAELPQEASALIRDNLSEADWAAFLALLEE